MRNVDSGRRIVLLGALAIASAFAFGVQLRGEQRAVDDDDRAVKTNSAVSEQAAKAKQSSGGGLPCVVDSDCKACAAGASNFGDPCQSDFDCFGGSCLVAGGLCVEQSAPVVLGFIGDPVTALGDAPPGTLRASVGADPGFRTWTETLLHITDCEIAPAHNYAIRTEANDNPGIFSQPLLIRTTPKPKGRSYGDLVGFFDGATWTPPNGLVNNDDVDAVVAFLQQSPAPHVTRVELAGFPPTFINFDVNGDELGLIVRAFQGETFPPALLVAFGYPADGDVTQCFGNLSQRPPLNTVNLASNFVRSGADASSQRAAQGSPAPPALPGIVSGIDHDITKDRFLSIDPSTNPGVATRLRLELVDMVCQAPLPSPCCLPDGSCVETLTSLECREAGGAVAASCAAGSCDLEGCCLGNGLCLMANPEACTVTFGGTSIPGSVCQGAGACCSNGGQTCTVEDAICCDDGGRTPLGLATFCDVAESCCLPDGTCGDVSPACCLDEPGGNRGGPGSACEGVDANADGFDDFCTPIQVGCCLPDNSCTTLTQFQCTGAGGIARCACAGNVGPSDDACVCAQAAPPTAEDAGLGTCLVDGDCTGASVCRGGICYIPKNRYVSFEPGATPGCVAYQITLDESADFSACVGFVTKWVGEPRDVSCQNLNSGRPLLRNSPCAGTTFVSRVVPQPVYREWTEGVVHIGDIEIVPNASYSIRAVRQACDSQAPGDFSVPLVLPTASPWGDVAAFGGAIIPDGQMDIFDFLAVLDALVGFEGQPPVVQADMSGGVPDHRVDLVEFAQIDQALALSDYPGGPPCPILAQLAEGPPPTASFSCKPGEESILYVLPGAEVDVEVFLDDALDLASFRTAIKLTLWEDKPPLSSLGDVVDEAELTGVRVDYRLCEIGGELDFSSPCDEAEDCSSNICLRNPNFVFSPSLTLVERPRTELDEKWAEVKLDKLDQNPVDGVDVTDPTYVATFTLKIDDLASPETIVGIVILPEQAPCAPGDTDCVSQGGGDPSSALTSATSNRIALADSTPIPPPPCTVRVDFNCNGNNFADRVDIAEGFDTDCNKNSIPDKCEIDATSTADGFPFFCTSNCEPDCNNNGRIDSCDVPVPLGNCIGINCSKDCQGNDIPDECDIDVLDPDGNEIVSLDCDGDGEPDECQLSKAFIGGFCDDETTQCEIDCENLGDGDGTLDVCNIALNPGLDCQGNGILDECDINGHGPKGPGSISQDCDGSIVDRPDECELSSVFPTGLCDDQTAECERDCGGDGLGNPNGILDSCDVVSSPSTVCDDNPVDGPAVLDICEAEETGCKVADLLVCGGASVFPGQGDDGYLASAIDGRFKLVWTHDAGGQEDSGGLLTGAGVSIGRTDRFRKPEGSPTAPPCVEPPSFTQTAGDVLQVETKILSMELLSNTGGSFRVRAENDELFFKSSLGETVGLCIDFPAEGYFDVFFEVTTGGGQILHNTVPLVLHGLVGEFPQDAWKYRMAQNFPAVPLVDATGVQRAYMTSAEFGGSKGTELPAICTAGLGVGRAVSFAVDGFTIGLTTPNNAVHFDTLNTPADKPLVVYASPSNGDSKTPNISNARVDTLGGKASGAPDFAASVQIAGLSFGLDGTEHPTQGSNSTALLYFSISRSAIGNSCTDLRGEAEADPNQASADIYLANMAAFGGLEDPGPWPSPCSVARGNCLALDQTALGLAPLLFPSAEDNVDEITALEVGVFANGSGSAYLTFSTDPGTGVDPSTVYLYDGIAPFDAANLTVFAVASQIGIKDDDEIDAIAVSDGGTLGTIDVGDSMLFSLATGSPSLDLGQCNVVGGNCTAGDILLTAFDGTISIHAGYKTIGLAIGDDVDAIDVGASTVFNDCNTNGINDACDIAREFSVDDGKGIPDECKFSEPLVAAFPHDIQKNRFVSIDPNNPSFEVSIKVELLDLECSVIARKCSFASDCKTCDSGVDQGAPCDINSQCTDSLDPAPPSLCVPSGESCEQVNDPEMLGWVSDPVASDGIDAPPDTFTSFVQKTRPAARAWPESILHVSDCEIAPVETYAFSTTPDGIGFSTQLIVATTPKPEAKFWADVVGRFDGVFWSGPNFLVNVDDVSAVIKFLSLKPAPHVTVLDLVGGSPTYTNFDVSVTELQMVIEGFEGKPFPPAALTELNPPYPTEGVTACP